MFDLKAKSPKLGEEIMEAIQKLIQDQPHGRWFKYKLELEFDARRNTDDSSTISAIVLKPKEEVVPPPENKDAGMHSLEGSKEGAASFLKALKKL